MSWVAWQSRREGGSAPANVDYIPWTDSPSAATLVRWTKATRRCVANLAGKKHLVPYRNLNGGFNRFLRLDWSAAGDGFGSFTPIRTEAPTGGSTGKS